jgi:hypothetical protein
MSHSLAKVDHKVINELSCQYLMIASGSPLGTPVKRVCQAVGVVNWVTGFAYITSNNKITINGKSRDCNSHFH